MIVITLKRYGKNFRALTSHQDENVGGVLTLIDMDQKAVFGKSEKCMVLQYVHFGGKYLEKQEFDGKLKDEVERRLQEIVEETDFQGPEETQYLNRDITEEETEAALQSKKISNDQELIQSDPTSCPQNQKGNN